MRRIADKIFSWDSMAWTRPVSKELHDKHPYSAKTEEQRELFFIEYLKSSKEIIGEEYEELFLNISGKTIIGG